LTTGEKGEGGDLTPRRCGHDQLFISTSSKRGEEREGVLFEVARRVALPLTLHCPWRRKEERKRGKKEGSPKRVAQPDLHLTAGRKRKEESNTTWVLFSL